MRHMFSERECNVILPDWLFWEAEGIKSNAVALILSVLWQINKV